MSNDGKILEMIKKVYKGDPEASLAIKKILIKEKLSQKKLAKQEMQENISAVAYSEAAEEFEENLGNYLFKDRRSLDAVTKLLKIYTKKYPLEENTAAYSGKDPTFSGVVGNRVSDLKNVLAHGNLREKLNMIEAFSYHVLDNRELKENKPRTPKKYYPDIEGKKEEKPQYHSSIEREADKNMKGVVDNFYRGDRYKRTELDEHSRSLYTPKLRRTYLEAKYYYTQKKMLSKPKVKEYLSNLKRLEEVEAKIKSKPNEKEKQDLEKERTKLEKLVAPLDESFRKELKPGNIVWDMKMGTQFQQQGNNRSVRIVAGPSGTTKVLMTVAKKLGADKQLLIGLRLAILGVYLTEGHHSFHEIMMVSKAFGMQYTDSDERYMFIAPLGIKELVTNVAKYKDSKNNGKLPHEIGKSLNSSQSPRRR